MKIKPNTELICGCCGSYFKTWEGYTDQDHDCGYGVCQPCQDWIKEREETEYKKLMDQAIELIKKSLKKENSIGFSKMSREKQETMANGMIKEGILKIGYGSAMREG